VDAHHVAIHQHGKVVALAKCAERHGCEIQVFSFFQTINLTDWENIRLHTSCLANLAMAAAFAFDFCADTEFAISISRCCLSSWMF
jgi:hypothetical protein